MTTTTPNKYLKGKIYKIVCNITGETYIGSTTEEYLTRRLSGHRMQYKQYLKTGDKKKYVSSFQILERDDYNIDLVEITPCNSRDELLKKEREWYDKIENINMIRPFVSVEEKKKEKKERQRTEEYKEYLKLYYQTKEYKQHVKEYETQNKEKIKATKQAYRENNREQFNEYAKKWYLKNSEKINCGCGGCYKLAGKCIHFKTQRHQEFERIQQQNNNLTV